MGNTDHWYQSCVVSGTIITVHLRLYLDFSFLLKIQNHANEDLIHILENLSGRIEKKHSPSTKVSPYYQPNQLPQSICWVTGGTNLSYTINT